MTRSPESIYALAGRVGGFVRASRHDGREATASARATFVASFESGHACSLCPEVVLPADLLPGERQRRAQALRASHYARMAMASAQARSKTKRAAPVRNGTASEGDRARDHSPEVNGASNTATPPPPRS